MKFLFLNSARKWGGNEKWTLMAYNALGREHEVFLAFRKSPIGLRFKGEKIKLPFINEFDLFTLSKLILFIRKYRIDVLIPTKRKDYVLSGMAAKICNITNVLRLGIVRDLKPVWYNRLVYDTLAHGIIVNARKIKKSLVNTGFISEEKVAVIYNGLDVLRLYNYLTIREKNSLEKPFSFTVSSMGTLCKRKRFDALIRGFARFLDMSRAGDAGLVIIGSGAEAQTLKTIAADLKIEDRVRFTGFLKEPYKELAKSDIFAMMTDNEGISNALIEAMFLLNCVITSSAGGTKEVFINGTDGVILETNDEESLADSILNLYRNRDSRLAMAKEGHKKVCLIFSMDRMEQEIVTFCKSLRLSK